MIKMLHLNPVYSSSGCMWHKKKQKEKGIRSRIKSNSPEYYYNYENRVSKGVKRPDTQLYIDCCTMTTASQILYPDLCLYWAKMCPDDRHNILFRYNIPGLRSFHQLTVYTWVVHPFTLSKNRGKWKHMTDQEVLCSTLLLFLFKGTVHQHTP